MITYANQKIVKINKLEEYKNGEYLSVGIDEWVEASKNLAPNTFKVYLYLCGNKDGFDLALSKQTVINLLDISADSYKRAIKELTEKDYIVHNQGNIYNFYCKPMVAEMHLGAETHPDRGQNCTHTRGKDAPRVGAEMHPEISKISKISNLSKSADAPKREEERALEQRVLENKPLEERALEDLTDNELESIREDYKKRVDYKVTRERLRLNRQITKEIQQEVDDILLMRKQDNNKAKILDRVSISLDKDITLDDAHRYVTKGLGLKITKEEMQEDMDMHSLRDYAYTWNDIVNFTPTTTESLDDYYSYSAEVCYSLGVKNDID